MLTTRPPTATGLSERLFLTSFCQKNLDEFFIEKKIENLSMFINIICTRFILDALQF